MKKWYVIHTQTGSEFKVKTLIEERVKNANMQADISRVYIPTEQVSEIKKGKKMVSERKFFPGYVLVEMELTDDAWALVRKTPGVTGFIGANNKPTALTEQEVAQIVQKAEETQENPTPKMMFAPGEAVRVIEGPFLNFSGVVDEVFLDKGKVRVSVSIFGRTTPVELEFWQVEKI